MNKTIYSLQIDEHNSEITEYTFPLLKNYARRCNAEFVVINERKFPEWPVTYEKLQIYNLARERDDEWSIYIDSDALVHPDTPDFTAFMEPGCIAHNATDPSYIRFRNDEWFLRDGRFIGSANWFTIAHRWCRDLWHPLEEYTVEEALDRISPIVQEWKTGLITPEHLIDDYVLSHNIARFGLKVTTILEIIETVLKDQNRYLYHQYLVPPELKLYGSEETNDAGEKVVKGIVDILNAWQITVNTTEEVTA